jgi:hypothetical protein
MELGLSCYGSHEYAKSKARVVVGTATTYPRNAACTSPNSVGVCVFALTYTTYVDIDEVRHVSTCVARDREKFIIHTVSYRTAAKI